MAKKLIPFWMLPASWGLKGKSRQIAEAEYLHHDDPYLLACRLSEVESAGETDHLIRLLKVNIEYGVGDEKQHRFDLVDLELEGHDKELAVLNLKKEYGDISDSEYEKETATLRGEPWVVVKTISTDVKNPSHGSMELDWNKFFVTHLEESGYGPAPTDEEIVDQWLTELCRNIAMESFDGVGEFSEKAAASEARRHSDVVFTHELDNKKEK